MAYTPGLWIARLVPTPYSVGDIRWAASVWAPHGISETRGYKVADILKKGDGVITAHDNARLIAGAPRVLETAQVVLGTLDIVDLGAFPELFAPELDELRAAIEASISGTPPA